MALDLIDNEFLAQIDGIEVLWLDGPRANSDGQYKKFRAALFPAKKLDDEAAKGSIILSPGRTEAIEKYSETILEFVNQGFAVLCIDQRGQGMSDRLANNPMRGHIDNFDNAAACLKIAYEKCAEKLPVPLILLGHSMGGAITLLALLRGFLPKIAKAIFISPMWALDTFKLARPLANIFCFVGLEEKTALTLNENWQPEEFATNKVTYDSKKFARNQALMLANPKIQIGGPTNGWAKAAFDMMDEFTPINAAKIDIPTLIFSASDEQIVKLDKHQEIAAAMPNAKLVLIENAKHEILQEKDEIRAKFWAAFNEFTK